MSHIAITEALDGKVVDWLEQAAMLIMAGRNDHASNAAD